MTPVDYKELFYTALNNAIFWQNRCCDMSEVIELFCLDAEATETPPATPKGGA